MIDRACCRFLSGFSGNNPGNAQSNVYFFEPAEINGMKVDGMKWIGNKYQVEINDKT